jgi:hypothetical protein
VDCTAGFKRFAEDVDDVRSLLNAIETFVPVWNPWVYPKL